MRYYKQYRNNNYQKEDQNHFGGRWKKYMEQNMIDIYSGIMKILQSDIMSIIIRKDMKKFKNNNSLYQII